MPLYENVFIARQDISGAQVDALADSFAQLIADNGGEVKKREYWGLRNLAYRMRKNRKGHYVLMNLSAPPAAIAELERTMRINEDVLRYLTIRVEALDEGPVGDHAEPRQPRRPRPAGSRATATGSAMASRATAASGPVPRPGRTPGRRTRGANAAAAERAVAEPAVAEPAVAEPAVAETVEP